MGEQASDSVVINAPPEAVMAVILDLEAYPLWSDDIKKVKVLSTDEQGRPASAMFDVDARVAQVNYTLEYDYESVDGVSWTLTAGDVLRKLDGRYELAATDAGTHVTYALEADIALPVPGFLKKRATKTILDTGLSGLKRRVESLG